MRGRFYNPVAIRNNIKNYDSGDHYDHYGVRGEGGHRNRVMAGELNLTRLGADLLCDLLEKVREYAFNEALEGYEE